MLVQSPIANNCLKPNCRGQNSIIDGTEVVRVAIDSSTATSAIAWSSFTENLIAAAKVAVG